MNKSKCAVKLGNASPRKMRYGGPVNKKVKKMMCGGHVKKGK